MAIAELKPVRRELGVGPCASAGVSVGSIMCGVRRGCADLSLCGGANDDVTYIDTVRLFDGEGDGAGHRVR